MLNCPKKESYYERTKHIVSERSKKWHEANKDKPGFKQKAALRSKNWSIKNKERRKEIDRAKYIRNKEKHISMGKKRHQERMLTDELYRIKQKLRWSLRDAFRRIRKNKPAKTEELLGCSWEEAKAHFESLFQEGMSWDNHGEWHIDHIKPVCSFTVEDIHLMNHISNLQPLWANENTSKGGKEPSFLTPFIVDVSKKSWSNFLVFGELDYC